MQLSYLLKDFITLPAMADRDIARLTLDSRRVGANDLFLAVKGVLCDGRQFITEAVQKGAAAVLLETDKADETIAWQGGVPIIPIQQLPHQLGKLAARFYDQPAAHLRMIGVTGTSGKTSCTHFIAQVMQSLHIPCGIIGTLGSGFYGALGETGLTTPDAISLQATLHDLLRQGASTIAMEVSSHSIDQGRINAVPFEIGIFTNLTQDHLDYHGDMAAYAAVKRRFIAEFPLQHAIINLDDPYGRTWASDLAKHQSVYAYATEKPPASMMGAFPIIYAQAIQLSKQGIVSRLATPWGEGTLSLPLVGKFNLSNALAVLTTLCVYGIPFDEALRQLAQLKTVPGRMQTLGGKGQPLVVVDYAHKPDALEKVLQVLRAHTNGKLICVFGCGGERDQSKRPLMAKITETLADQVIVTNDNPRREKPEAIAAQIMQGFSRPERVLVELDRSKAIKNSIQCASAEDCILIAGKGAEKYQQVGEEKIPFDDVEQALMYLNGE
ncbi:UDP-N-acetylmuramoyl-L-alanyl-D-glutamate--2,6-diaminopimelate ligase [Aquicella lusitana]|uniref:UDP-N-acetylmuramoyl-L-alanyl-D-glutamate--2,6-diaminopimelate ligase n=1 Tax=Aquicella lusitana TaxID=254246 RepID=A0A370GLZ4_9COXI|nr:UDP-N-acetylmuramoyl-L-alanyl-D-glutamate--2,6-diaminopimelate ligase [Aquicella lusitana]RDI44772.1 UDP-N-acetylmuramoylalanyl-D-glutamate--2,6-diaminopimelate ligase [Aquicella lusitana]VVC72969.1 UDP-N-acetylmuramoyl-L-alanyl-D-glutamate--2, 6-diaminopimelate ligase [Aquicella lusitana]